MPNLAVLLPKYVIFVIEVKNPICWNTKVTPVKLAIVQHVVHQHGRERLTVYALQSSLIAQVDQQEAMTNNGESSFSKYLPTINIQFRF